MSATFKSSDELARELEPASPEVKRYQRRKIQIGLIAIMLNLVIVTVMAIFAGPWLKPHFNDWLGTSPWLQLIATAVSLGVVVEALTFPLDFYSSFILEHQNKLSTQTFPKWLWKKIKGYLVGGIIGLPLLLGLYAIIWSSEGWWWLWATAGWLAVTLVMGRIMPVLILPLFYKVTRLEDDTLQTRLEKIAAGTGLNIEGVYRLHLSEETKKANAALTGLGKTRRVLLGDTLLEDFTPEEIEVVFAHEVGHHVYNHLPKMIVWGVVTAVTSFWLADVILRTAAPSLGYDGFSDPVALPLLMLVLAAFSLLLSPLQNFVSRIFENQCDRYALDRTGMKEAYRSAFIKLAKQNKSDPDPNPIVVWLFYDHPPIRARLAQAEDG